MTQRRVRTWIHGAWRMATTTLVIDELCVVQIVLHDRSPLGEENGDRVAEIRGNE